MFYRRKVRILAGIGILKTLAVLTAMGVVVVVPVGLNGPVPVLHVKTVALSINNVRINANTTVSTKMAVASEMETLGTGTNMLPD